MKVVADRAYDSDKVRSKLADRDLELVCPHRHGRVRKPTQDGRKLKPYKRRWKVERLFAWLNNFRRIVVRWEYYAENFHAFVQLACTIILVRYL